MVWGKSRLKREEISRLTGETMDKDKFATQEFAIMNILVSHCGQTSHPIILKRSWQKLNKK
jgi:hypothetical protein